MSNFDLYQIEFVKQINVLAGFETYRAFWDYEQDSDAQHRHIKQTRVAKSKDKN